jgi:hypothetical protein
MSNLPDWVQKAWFGGDDQETAIELIGNLIKHSYGRLQPIYAVRLRNHGHWAIKVGYRQRDPETYRWTPPLTTVRLLVDDAEPLDPCALAHKLRAMATEQIRCECEQRTEPAPDVPELAY